MYNDFVIRRCIVLRFRKIIFLVVLIQLCEDQYEESIWKKTINET
jgi:hypothetical protein